MSDLRHRAKIFWNGAYFLNALTVASEKGTRKGALIIAEKAKQIVEDSTMRGDSESTGYLVKHIGVMKRKFNRKLELGWMAGVWDTRTSIWEHSTGAYALFLEYGHAFPGMGRGGATKRRRKDVVKSVREYPFLRPAFKNRRRAVHKIVLDEMRKAIR